MIHILSQSDLYKNASYPCETDRHVLDRYGSFDIITQTIDILALLINVSGKRNGKILMVVKQKNIKRHLNNP